MKDIPLDKCASGSYGMGRRYFDWEKSVNQALRLAAKGSKWRQKQGVLFRQIDDYFFAVEWETGWYSNDPPRFIYSICAKPMSIDPLLWATVGDHDLEQEPLSFRYWGSFTCGVPKVETWHIAEPLTPDEYAGRVFQTANTAVFGCMQKLAQKPFSSVAKKALADGDTLKMKETLVFSLLAEGKKREAKKVAASFGCHVLVDGQSGNTFIDIATGRSNTGSFVDNLISKLKRGEP